MPSNRHAFSQRVVLGVAEPFQQSERRRLHIACRMLEPKCGEARGPGAESGLVLGRFAGHLEGGLGDIPVWGAEEFEGPSGASVFLKLLGVPLLAAYALVLWPILLIIVALFNTIAPAFNPALVLKIVNEVKAEYTRLLLFITVLLLPWGVLSVLATRG